MKLQCFHCSEPIDLDDNPPPQLNNRGSEAMHGECLLYTLVGSVGHQKGTCPCRGGTEEDPPGLTLRQAARAAWDHYHRGVYFKAFEPAMPAYRNLSEAQAIAFDELARMVGVSSRQLEPEGSWRDRPPLL